MSDLEWALATSKATSGSGRVAELVGAVNNADFRSVLLSSEVTSALARVPGLLDGLQEGATDTEASGSKPSVSGDDALILLIAAVALQHSFAQANWTGPDLDFGPADVIAAVRGSEVTDSEAADTAANAGSLPPLTLLGEPAYHLAAHPALFLLSVRVLAYLQDSGLKTLPWWRVRSHLVHLALLDEAVALSEDVLQAAISLVDVTPDADTAAALQLELGLLHNKLGQDRAANQAFLSAARSSGLEFELTGAMGKRTKFQVEEYSQLVLLAESRKRDDDSAPAQPQSRAEQMPQNLALNDDTLLEETEFTKVTQTPGSGALAHLDPSNQPPLYPLDQALLLALCLCQSNNSPAHGLTNQQMMPFLARVISHPRNWSVHTTALLLRSRLEANRSRTVERSTLQLAALIDQMPTADSAPAERLLYFHQLPLPSKWEMERELAKRYLSLGVIRSALEIFTRLEMWEDAVTALQRMEQDAEAERIVRDLLEGRKIESDVVVQLGKQSLSDSRRQKLSAARAAKLWCVLGDLALNSEEALRNPEVGRQAAIEMYEKAWEVSGHSSSRAQRSLGAVYTGMQDYEAAIPAFRNALAINPLYAQAWFTLGVCLMRLGRWTEARDAFKRQVGVSPEDSEGWNNLAAVYLRMNEEGLQPGETPAQPSFETKQLAFNALKSGLRGSYDNWRMWQNYMVVAIDVGELSEAVRAMTRVVEVMGEKDPILAINPDVLDKLVDAISRDNWNNGDGPEDGRPPPTSNEGWGLLPLVERLFDTTIFPRINDDPRVWRAHARLLRWKEDWAGALEDYVRAYRAEVVLDERVERDRTRWRQAVEDVEDLVATFQLLGPKVPKVEGKKGGDWRFQARGIVRTFMGRTKDAFEGEPEWDRLKDLLDDLKRSD